jgi:hypothetical protein
MLWTRAADLVAAGVMGMGHQPFQATAADRTRAPMRRGERQPIQNNRPACSDCSVDVILEIRTQPAKVSVSDSIMEESDEAAAPIVAKVINGLS